VRGRGTDISLAGETPRWCETQSIHVTDGYYRNISTITI